MNKLLPVLCCAALGMASPVSAAITALSYTSSTASLVGAGESRTILKGEAGLSFTVTPSLDYLILSVIASNPLIGMDFDPAHFWFVGMAPPRGSILGTGHYTNAMYMIYREGDSPGLIFGVNTRSPGQLEGEFTILELQSNSNGSVISFAADFIQYDEGDPLKWNKGSVRFNSNVPLTIPEPQTATLALLALGACHRRRRRSFQFSVFRVRAPETA
ncbi:MAG: hypothetical protein EOP86_13140 [Verrucomicrobiaceae bacterium]|nr:MAG: hypothetical protein EOP86_13140 [Verrucomicrobiaceae bacterium]